MTAGIIIIIIIYRICKAWNNYLLDSFLPLNITYTAVTVRRTRKTTSSSGRRGSFWKVAYLRLLKSRLLKRQLTERPTLRPALHSSLWFMCSKGPRVSWHSWTLCLISVTIIRCVYMFAFLLPWTDCSAWRLPWPENPFLRCLKECHSIPSAPLVSLEDCSGNVTVPARSGCREEVGGAVVRVRTRVWEKFK